MSHKIGRMIRFSLVLLLTPAITHSVYSAWSAARADTDMALDVDGPGDFPPLPSLSYPASPLERIEEMYRFAANHGELFRYVPCYCLCSKSLHHKSLEDCFIRSRGELNSSIVWSRHGGECAVCLAVAADAKRLYLAGKSVAGVQFEIDRAYRTHFPNRTDTPEPPNTGDPYQHFHE